MASFRHTTDARDVWLSNVHRSCRQQRLDVRRGLRTLAAGDGDVQLCAQASVTLEIGTLQGLLEPPVAELLEHATHARRLWQLVALVRVGHEAELGTRDVTRKTHIAFVLGQ